MSEPINDPVDQEATPAAGGEVTTFTQAEVDALVSKEKAKAVAKATKGMPTAEELTAFRTWQESQQTEQEKWNKLTNERDTANSALAAANVELEQLKREKHLITKGVSYDDVEYYAFKIGKLVSENKTFEQATEDFFKENTPNKVRVDMTAPLDGKQSAKTPNDAMNALIRGAFK